MSLKMRPTTDADLPFVVELESRAASDRFVIAQPREEHERLLADENIRHLIVEDEGRAVGYAILAGLKDRHDNVEFRRLVIGEAGRGYGRQVLREIKRMAFETLGAHRLWLDVKDFNTRARALYESEGFRVEGTWRECVKGENGRESLVFMSILRSEYEI